MELVYSFLVSFLCCFLIVRFGVLIFPSCADDLAGVQKIHSGRVPRIGGLAIVAGVLTGSTVSPQAMDDSFFYFMCFAVTTFVIGFVEDLSGKLGPWVRLALTGVVAFGVTVVCSLRVHDLGYPFLTQLLLTPGVSLFFVVIAIAGVTNAMNVIDGLNGLSAGIFTIACSAILLTISEIQAASLMSVSVTFIGAALGFLAFNLPAGRLFLGDGGAYFLGFSLSWLVIETSSVQHAVSAWLFFVLLSHPIIETLGSVIRRKWSGRGAFLADTGHLHSLVREYLFQKFRVNHHFSEKAANNTASCILLILNLVVASLGIVFRDSTLDLTVIFFTVVFLHTISIIILRRNLNNSEVKP